MPSRMLKLNQWFDRTVEIKNDCSHKTIVIIGGQIFNSWLLKSPCSQILYPLKHED